MDDKLFALAGILLAGIAVWCYEMWVGERRDRR